MNKLRKQIFLGLILAILLSSVGAIPTKAYNINFFANLSKNKMDDVMLALLVNAGKIENEVVKKDVRSQKINKYFEERNMPLEGYGKQFIKIADKYDLDWRLLPAIAVRESSGGKHLLNNNPFGWGSCKIAFKDFNESIEVVGMNLSGNNPNTARYYADNSVKEKLYYYNGTVIPSYPDEVIHIMGMFEDIELS
ncbi:MAG: hypothetical protein HOA57_03605 [Candidatus Magasanikbacteria bacterium]|nr:hypothetical protein [Candidatus Magasanikbacteria bacterium]MBT4314558.1 hypothetical protein [Candidatus Magasanikbacteria bacterium]MBT4547456.1 hypothetical protein [Candidatus Magasanikbacteria bacterium]MBT6819438.1 hypothetical protein [Candidatus Magasanikbacteria bacterium]